MDYESTRNMAFGGEYKDFHKQHERNNNIAKLDGIDRKELSKKSDKDLAVWQTEYTPDSPQYVLAEHEWQRRLLADQIKSNRFAAFIGLFGAVLGALIGASVSWLTAQYF